MNINIVTATIMTISIRTVLHTNCSTQGICVTKVSELLGYAECCYTEFRYDAQCHGAQSNEMKMNSLT